MHVQLDGLSDRLQLDALRKLSSKYHFFDLGPHWRRHPLPPSSPHVARQAHYGCIQACANVCNCSQLHESVFCFLHLAALCDYGTAQLKL